MIDFESLAKILPIKAMYDDLLSPGFKRTGEMIEDFVQAIRLALPQLQLDAVAQEKFRKLIEDPFFRVDPVLRTLPPSQLIGQVLEGARYEPVDSPIWKMFEELLQRGYDLSREHEAHPAYAGIIKQLSPDEALMLASLQQGPRDVLMGYCKTFGLEEYLAKDQIGLEFDNLRYKENINFYAQHLEALGLIGMLVFESGEVFTEGPKAGLAPMHWTLQLNILGEYFCKAVLRERQS